MEVFFEVAAFRLNARILASCSAGEYPAKCSIAISVSILAARSLDKFFFGITITFGPFQGCVKPRESRCLVSVGAPGAKRDFMYGLKPSILLGRRKLRKRSSQYLRHFFCRPPQRLTVFLWHAYSLLVVRASFKMSSS